MPLVNADGNSMGLIVLSLGLVSAVDQGGAIIELTGDAPKILFGQIDAPVCQVTLNRTEGHLTSTCDLHPPSNAMAEGWGQGWG